MYYCFRVHGRRSLDRTLSGSRVFGGKSLGGFRGDHGALGLGFRVMGQYNRRSCCKRSKVPQIPVILRKLDWDSVSFWACLQDKLRVEGWRCQAYIPGEIFPYCTLSNIYQRDDPIDNRLGDSCITRNPKL